MDSANRRILATLLFSVFATVIGVGLVVPLLPVHAHELGAGGLHIALVFGAYALSRAFFLPVFGRWSDQKGRKTFITIGLLAYAVVSIALVYIDTIAALVIVRLLHGVASAMLIPVFQAYAADLAPAGREGRVMGIYGSVVLIGMSLGPFLGGIIDDRYGYQATFWLMGILALTGFVTCVCFLPPVSSEKVQRDAKMPPAWRELLRDRVLAGLITFRFAYVVCVGIVWAFVPLHASLSVSMTSASIGLVITLGIASCGILNTPMGLLADRVDRRAMVITGGAISAIGIAAFASAHSVATFAVSSIAFGIGGGVCMPALMAFAARRGARADANGSVMALMTMAHSLGMLIGAFLGGVLMDIADLRWVFTAGALVMGCGTIHFALTSQERRFARVDASTPLLRAEDALPIDAVATRQ